MRFQRRVLVSRMRIGSDATGMIREILWGEPQRE